MLLLLLIGAALRHVRPEPPAEVTLPTGPLLLIREKPRLRYGASVLGR